MELPGVYNSVAEEERHEGHREMKTLFSAIVTEKFMPRYRRTVEVQDVFFPDGLKGIDRILMTDDETDAEKLGLQVVRRDLKKDGVFNHSKARNLVLDYAWENGYDWLLDGDADRVVMAPPDQYPSSGFSVLQMHYAKKEDSPEELRKRWLEGGLEANQGGAFFVLPRSAFMKARFCEDFRFTRWEDIDYTAHVLPRAGIQARPACGRGLHLWHPGGEHILETLTLEGFAENEALYKSRHAKPAGGAVDGL